MKVFVTGATGYIGGSVSQALLQQGHDVLGLTRSVESAEKLRASGITPLLGTLDDADALTHGAKWADATINAANSDHFGAVCALISALEGTGKRFIHTSGSSVVVDDAMGDVSIDKVFSDDEPFIPMSHRVPRVTIDQMVREAGVRKGLHTAVVCPSMIYGDGIGLHRDSDQLPKLIVKAKEVGAGVYIGKGLNIWSNVHINDVIDLYLLTLQKAPSASFFFAENGEANFKDIAEWIGHSEGFNGAIQSWPANQAIASLGGFARVALATNCRVRAVNARQVLGWSPSAPSLREYLLKIT